MQLWFRSAMVLYFISSIYYTHPRSVLPPKTQPTAHFLQSQAQSSIVQRKNIYSSRHKDIVRSFHKSEATNNTKSSIPAVQFNKLVRKSLVRTVNLHENGRNRRKRKILDSYLSDRFRKPDMSFGKIVKKSRHKREMQIGSERRRRKANAQSKSSFNRQVGTFSRNRLFNRGKQDGGKIYGAVGEVKGRSDRYSIFTPFQYEKAQKAIGENLGTFDNMGKRFQFGTASRQTANIQTPMQDNIEAVYEEELPQGSPGQEEIAGRKMFSPDSKEYVAGSPGIRTKYALPANIHPNEYVGDYFFDYPEPSSKRVKYMAKNFADDDVSAHKVAKFIPDMTAKKDLIEEAAQSQQAQDIQLSGAANHGNLREKRVSNHQKKRSNAHKIQASLSRHIEDLRSDTDARNDAKLSREQLKQSMLQRNLKSFRRSKDANKKRRDFAFSRQNSNAPDVIREDKYTYFRNSEYPIEEQAIEKSSREIIHSPESGVEYPEYSDALEDVYARNSREKNTRSFKRHRTLPAEMSQMQQAMKEKSNRDFKSGEKKAGVSARRSYETVEEPGQKEERDKSDEEIAEDPIRVAENKIFGKYSRFYEEKRKSVKDVKKSEESAPEKSASDHVQERAGDHADEHAKYQTEDFKINHAEESDSKERHSENSNEEHVEKSRSEEQQDAAEAAEAEDSENSFIEFEETGPAEKSEENPVDDAIAGLANDIAKSVVGIGAGRSADVAERARSEVEFADDVEAKPSSNFGESSEVISETRRKSEFVANVGSSLEEAEKYPGASDSVEVVQENVEANENFGKDVAEEETDLKPEYLAQILEDYPQYQPQDSIRKKMSSMRGIFSTNQNTEFLPDAEETHFNSYQRSEPKPSGNVDYSPLQQPQRNPSGKMHYNPNQGQYYNPNQGQYYNPNQGQYYNPYRTPQLTPSEIERYNSFEKEQYNPYTETQFNSLMESRYNPFEQAPYIPIDALNQMSFEDAQDLNIQEAGNVELSESGEAYKGNPGGYAPEAFQQYPAAYNPEEYAPNAYQSEMYNIPREPQDYTLRKYQSHYYPRKTHFHGDKLERIFEVEPIEIASGEPSRFSFQSSEEFPQKPEEWPFQQSRGAEEKDTESNIPSGVQSAIGDQDITYILVEDPEQAAIQKDNLYQSSQRDMKDSLSANEFKETAPEDTMDVSSDVLSEARSAGVGRVPFYKSPDVRYEGMEESPYVDSRPYECEEPDFILGEQSEQFPSNHLMGIEEGGLKSYAARKTPEVTNDNLPRYDMEETIEHHVYGYENPEQMQELEFGEEYPSDQSFQYQRQLQLNKDSSNFLNTDKQSAVQLRDTSELSDHFSNVRKKYSAPKREKRKKKKKKGKDDDDDDGAGGEGDGEGEGESEGRPLEEVECDIPPVVPVPQVIKVVIEKLTEQLIDECVPLTEEVKQKEALECIVVPPQEEIENLKAEMQVETECIEQPPDEPVQYVLKHIVECVETPSEEKIATLKAEIKKACETIQEKHKIEPIEQTYKEECEPVPLEIAKSKEAKEPYCIEVPQYEGGKKPGKEKGKPSAEEENCDYDQKGEKPKGKTKAPSAQVYEESGDEGCEESKEKQQKGKSKSPSVAIYEERGQSSKQPVGKPKPKDEGCEEETVEKPEPSQKDKECDDELEGKPSSGKSQERLTEGCEDDSEAKVSKENIKDEECEDDVKTPHKKASGYEEMEEEDASGDEQEDEKGDLRENERGGDEREDERGVDESEDERSGVDLMIKSEKKIIRRAPNEDDGCEEDQPKKKPKNGKAKKKVKSDGDEGCEDESSKARGKAKSKVDEGCEDQSRRKPKTKPKQSGDEGCEDQSRKKPKTKPKQSGDEGCEDQSRKKSKSKPKQSGDEGCEDQPRKKQKQKPKQSDDDDEEGSQNQSRKKQKQKPKQSDDDGEEGSQDQSRKKQKPKTKPKPKQSDGDDDEGSQDQSRKKPKSKPKQSGDDEGCDDRGKKKKVKPIKDDEGCEDQGRKAVKKPKEESESEEGCSIQSHPKKPKEKPKDDVGEQEEDKPKKKKKKKPTTTTLSPLQDEYFEDTDEDEEEPKKHKESKGSALVGEIDERKVVYTKQKKPEDRAGSAKEGCENVGKSGKGGKSKSGNGDDGEGEESKSQTNGNGDYNYGDEGAEEEEELMHKKATKHFHRPVMPDRSKKKIREVKDTREQFSQHIEGHAESIGQTEEQKVRENMVVESPQKAQSSDEAFVDEHEKHDEKKEEEEELRDSRELGARFGVKRHLRSRGGNKREAMSEHALQIHEEHERQSGNNVVDKNTNTADLFEPNLVEQSDKSDPRLKVLHRDQRTKQEYIVDSDETDDCEPPRGMKIKGASVSGISASQLDEECEDDFGDFAEPTTVCPPQTPSTEEPCQFHKEGRPVHYVSRSEVNMLIRPRYDGVIVTLGNVKVDADSTYIHRILNQYYYDVLLWDIAAVSDAKRQTQLYQEFNRNMCILLTVYLRTRAKTEAYTVTPEINRRNYFLRRLKKLAHEHRNREFPDPSTIPTDEDIYVGHCIKYTSYELLVLHFTHPMAINSGPLNIPDRVVWRKNGCDEFFEGADLHIAPEDDNEGVNIAPPTITPDKNVKFRGPKTYSERSLYKHRKLLKYYRCMIAKIASIPRRPERLCYFSQFHRRFLRFVKRYRHTIGRKKWHKLEDAIAWFSHRKLDTQKGKSLRHWDADRRRLIRITEQILTEGSGIIGLLSNLFPFSWSMIVSLSKQKLVALLGCVLLMLLLTFISGYNLLCALQRKRALAIHCRQRRCDGPASSQSPTVATSNSPHNPSYDTAPG